MSSSGIPTPKVQLNQWQGTDKPERLDFNSDNQKVDTAFIEISTQMSKKANQEWVDTTMATKMNIVEVLNDIDCHTLKTPKDYIVINTDKTVAGNVALHYPPETGYWGLTIKATLSVDGSNGKLYIATNRDSGNVWKKSEASSQFGKWELLSTATPPQKSSLPLVYGVIKYEGETAYWRTQNNVVHFVAHITSDNREYKNRHVATIPNNLTPKTRWLYPATGVGGSGSPTSFSGYARIIGTDTPETAGNIYIDLPDGDVVVSVFFHGEFIIGE